MLPESQISDLEQTVPKELRKPTADRLGKDPRKAVLRWIAAIGGDITGVTLDTVAQPGRSDNERLSVYPEFAALMRLALAERQASKAMPPTESEHPLVVSQLHPALERAGTAHRSNARLERATVLEQVTISMNIEDLCAERASLVQSLIEVEAEIWARYRELKALQFRMVDPAVVAGYFHDYRASHEERRTNALLYYLHDCSKVPLARSIAIVGGLRNRTIAVDTDHPDRDSIYENCERNLKRYRVRIRECQGPRGVGVYLSPGSGSGMCFPRAANEATNTRNRS
jgi:hypothetical protein